MIAHRVLDQPRGFGRGQAVLGLALELGIAHEHREHDFRAGHHVVGSDVFGLLLADQLAESTQPLGERGAQALFVRAAIGGGHGVAIPAGRAVGPQGPGNRPLHAALRHTFVVLGKVLIAGEEVGGDAFAAADLFLEMIGQAAGELEHSLLRNIVACQRLGAFPADFHAREQIGLRARQLEQALGAELALAEDLRVGNERDRGAAPVGGIADLGDGALRQALGKLLRMDLAVARHFHPCQHRKRVDHRHTDPVQAARGGIGLPRKLAARMQRGEDHLQRRLAGELGMLVNRHAAPVVGDRELARRAGRAFLQHHLDAVGMAGHGLVHRVVEHLGGEVMQRAVVGAADIHAGAPPNWLQPLKHLDGGGIVVTAGGRGIVEQVVAHGSGL